MNWPAMPGFVIAEQSETMCGYAISPDLSFENALGLIEWLPHDCELNFYDRFYPSNSDPGAYISFCKRFGVLTYRMGNHGWSSETEKQSAELLAAWLHLNRTSHDLFEARPYHLSVRRMDPH